VFRAVLVCGREFCPGYKIVSSCVVRGAAYDEFIPSLDVLPHFDANTTRFWLGLALPPSTEESHTVPILLAPNTGDHGREPAVVEDSSYDPVQLSPPIWLL